LDASVVAEHIMEDMCVGCPEMGNNSLLHRNAFVLEDGVQISGFWGALVFEEP